MSTKKQLASMTIVLATLSVPDAHAQWSFEPAVSVGFQYDDNLSLNSAIGADTSDESYAVEVEALIAKKSELSEFELVPRLLWNRFNDLSSLDSDDQFLTFDYSRTGQKTKFRFRGNYSDETVRTAERLDSDLDIEDLIDVPSDDSGQVLGNADRQRIRLLPYWSNQFTQKSLLGIQLEYTDVSYDGELAATRNDYKNSGGLLFYEHTLSPRNRFVLGGSAHRYKSEGDTEDNTGYSFTAGFRRAISETTTLKFNVGVDSTEDDAGDDQENVVGDISLIRRFETSRFLAAYRRNISGGGAGNQSVRDMVILNLTRELGERSELGFGIRAYQTTSLGDDAAAFDERDYLQLRAIYTLNITRQLAVDFDYRYTDIDREFSDGSEDSNRFNLWFRYRWVR